MNYVIRYIIKMPDQTKEYSLELDAKTARLVTPPDANPPEWAKLENSKCSVCTLKESNQPYCPVAAHLSRLVSDYENLPSFTKVTVIVETEDRSYGKKTDLQSALQSIFGAIMATCGCPALDYFRPMGRFHLPFGSLEDHLIRTTSFHLLRELFRFKSGLAADFSLVRLKEQYEKASDMNVNFAKRLATISKRDADRNAVVGLHSIAVIIGSEIKSNLDAVEGFFELTTPDGTSTTGQ